MVAKVETSNGKIKESSVLFSSSKSRLFTKLLQLFLPTGVTNVNKKLKWMSIAILIWFAFNLVLLRGMATKVADPPLDWISRINGGNMMYTPQEPSNVEMMASGKLSLFLF